MSQRNLVSLLFASACMLAACSGGGSSSDPPPPPPPSPPPSQSARERVAALEASGVLPTLDRSASVGGPDANGDGVRDDIESFIQKQSYTAPQAAAARQLAKSLQTTLLVDTADEAALRTSDVAVQRAVACVFGKFDAVVTANEVVKTYQKATANTKARTEAYAAYQMAMNGKVLASPQGENCD